ncbi:D-aminoacyl-tRNA deacylase [Leptolyngbya sp. 7M]|uniref:D-aminoacyl-tRNA deacylase n=1 Tax=Leptolyngbya sp. 7M TaxID=2812896 RepID=UPI001B8ADA85|nr:D-aminoacyl-tRNA deacylase [Leptolyngbya sp. 7M]QYO66324.1 D-tyrosyl-tRNA(Tyr) deacylase [Leptolyngbya sp. 7M]
MRAVVQRVSRASVSVDGEIVGAIRNGLLVLLGVRSTDDRESADYLADKIVNLRIFEDADGRMNKSLLESNGELLVVSQFTLYGDARKGRRPSFIDAAPPERANELYEHFVSKCKKLVETVKTGRFQAMMDVELVNNGPVTILLDSEKQI